MDTINITYRKHIPAQVFHGFTELKSPTTNIQLHNRGQEIYNNFDGGFLNDIAIYIHQNPESVIYGPAYYDLLKFAISQTWQALRMVYVGGIMNRELIESGGYGKISLTVKSGDGKVVTMDFDSNIERELIDSAIEKGLGYLQSPQKEHVFSNKDFVKKDNDMEIASIVYDKVNDDWKPFNFAEFQRKLQDLSEYLDDNS